MGIVVVASIGREPSSGWMGMKLEKENGKECFGE